MYFIPKVRTKNIYNFLSNLWNITAGLTCVDTIVHYVGGVGLRKYG